jgi:hypothetical protein
MKLVETHHKPVIVASMATEQTPLLADRPNDVESEIPSSNEEAALGSSVPIVEEPTNRQLALTMSCIWVCILLSPSSSLSKSFLFHSAWHFPGRSRFHHHRHARHADIGLLLLLLCPLVAGFGLPNCQCRVPTPIWPAYRFILSEKWVALL